MHYFLHEKNCEVFLRNSAFTSCDVSLDRSSHTNGTYPLHIDIPWELSVQLSCFHRIEGDRREETNEGFYLVNFEWDLELNTVRSPFSSTRRSPIICGWDCRPYPRSRWDMCARWPTHTTSSPNCPRWETSFNLQCDITVTTSYRNPDRWVRFAARKRACWQ